MRTTLALALAALCLTGAPGCRRWRRAHSARLASAVRWHVYPAPGMPLRVDDHRLLRGAVRVEDARSAPPPWPAAAFVAAAHLAGDRWAFLTEDGTAYRADRYDGALTVAGAIEGRAAPLHADDTAVTTSVRSEGALFAVDELRRAWAVGASGPPRRLPLERVVHGAFVTERVALAVVEPGVLLASRDGGEHFEAVALPAGLPLSVDVDASGASVRTTAGALRWSDGALEPEPGARAPGLRNVVDDTAAEVLARATDSLPEVPWSPGALAANPDGTVTVARRDAIVTLDPRTGRERSRVEPPGEDCVVARAADGLRATCRHGGWAAAVFALRDGAAGWALLRDELRAEPMGATAFDPRSRGWVVAAPCRQRPEADRRLLCVYPDAGAPLQVALPFPAVPLAMRDGTALVMDGEGRAAGPTRAALVRGGNVTQLALPLGSLGAQTAAFDGDAVVAWDLSPAGELRALVRGTATPEGGYAWRRVEAPPGSRRGAFAPGGRAYVAGADASVLAVSERGGPFRPLRPPVEGGASALALDLGGSWFCAGPWCRFGGNLLLATVGRAGATVLTRTDPPPPRPPRRLYQAWLRCGPAGPNADGPDLDRGAAIAGYAVRWQAAGEAVSLAWYGATLQGAATVRWPGATTRPMRALGAANATAPGALLERCAADGCDHAFASPAGLTDLGLARAIPGGVTLHAAAGGWLVRADDLREGVGIVTLVALDARGAERARRTFVLAEDPTRVAAGSFGDRPGLWVRTPDRRLRFLPVEPRPGDAAVEAAESHAACAPGAAHEGEAHLVTDMVLARGEGWEVEPGEWLLDETLHVAGGASCMASLAGGEPRDEAEADAERRGERERAKVRTVVLRAAEGGRFEGTAWGGRLAMPQRCTMADHPR